MTGLITILSGRDAHIKKGVQLSVLFCFRQTKNRLGPKRKKGVNSKVYFIPDFTNMG